jgi:hypothetical protein
MASPCCPTSPPQTGDPLLDAMFMGDCATSGSGIEAWSSGDVPRCGSATAGCGAVAGGLVFTGLDDDKWDLSAHSDVREDADNAGTHVCSMQQQQQQQHRARGGGMSGGCVQLLW